MVWVVHGFGSLLGWLGLGRFWAWSSIFSIGIGFGPPPSPLPSPLLLPLSLPTSDMTVPSGAWHEGTGQLSLPLIMMSRTCRARCSDDTATEPAISRDGEYFVARMPPGSWQRK